MSIQRDEINKARYVKRGTELPYHPQAVPFSQNLLQQLSEPGSSLKSIIWIFMEASLYRYD